MNLLKSDVIVTHDVNKELSQICSQLTYDKVFVLMDTNTEKYCYSLISSNDYLKDANCIVIPAGEKNKNIDTVSLIWKQLNVGGAKRNSLFINLGGGMVSDIGGFAASCFKRGISFINIPTTLLAQVDASAGGKTGFNFMGYKNEIGVFSMPERVVVCPEFLKSLGEKDFISGFAEMLKHALIWDEKYLHQLMEYDLNNIDYKKIAFLVSESVKIKQEVVDKDPEENNIRKSLNFGHTIGHAFESYALSHEIELFHGEAVALGIIGELYMSCKLLGFPKDKYEKIKSYILGIYPDFKIKNIEEDIFKLMLHDKKNISEGVNFTLLKDVGSFEIDNYCGREEIIEALKQY